MKSRCERALARARSTSRRRSTTHWSSASMVEALGGGQTPLAICFGAPHHAAARRCSPTRALFLSGNSARSARSAADAAADGGGGDGGARRLRAGRSRARRAAARAASPSTAASSASTRARRSTPSGRRRAAARCRRWRARGATARRRCRRPTCRRRRGWQAILPGGDANGRGALVLSGGQWDGALSAYPEGGRTLSTHHQHSRAITCVALSSSHARLLTGASDTTVVLWLDDRRRRRRARRRGGHARRCGRCARCAATCASGRRWRSSLLGVAASGAADGAVLLHTCHNGCLLRSIAHPASQPVAHLHVSAVHCRVAFGSPTRAPPSSTSTRCRARGSTPSTRRAASAARSSRPTAPSSSSAAARHLAACRVDDGQLACLFEPTAAGVSCATVSARCARRHAGGRGGGVRLRPERRLSEGRRPQR